jgi:hypothetical protein
MAAFTKFNQYVADLGLEVHKHDSDTHKFMLTLVAPVATNSVKADLTEIASGNGYTAGGNTGAVTSWGQSSGTAKLVLADPATWTASGGSMAAFRYVVLYNDSSASDSLIGFWDYGSTITLAVTETFTADADPTNGILTLA